MLKKIFFFTILMSFLHINYAVTENITKIIIQGNERISEETIKIFSRINVNETLDETGINKVIKDLYETNYFKDVSINYTDSILTISVVENPIIQDLSIIGIKSKFLEDKIRKNLLLRSRSSFNNFLISEDKKRLDAILKNEGYFFSKINTSIENLIDNKINIEYEIQLGEKSKIKKISFVGNKIFKDAKLKNIIVSEEYKLWKFISGKKYLNQNMVDLDKRLLKNFYLNQGYYNVIINSSFAKLLDNDKFEFELIYNIQANDRIYFNDLTLNLPTDFNKDNFLELTEIFKEIKGEPYSLNRINKIIDKLDNITLREEYKSIKAKIVENIVDRNKLNLDFQIDETEIIIVENINIFGNNITQENVIRNQFELDEGDPYNEILENKTVNNIKSLGFFKNVTKETIQTENKTKIINLTVEEKPTGEILAGAGFGTGGSSLTFSVKENNYLGKGIKLGASMTTDEKSIKGLFSVSNPNFLNTDKSTYFQIEAQEFDLTKNSGYKSNKTGFTTGLNFEYLDDLNLGLGNSIYFEKIETNNTASVLQKSQAGNYFDGFLKLDLDYDKRNQKFQPSEGFRSFYSLDLPIVSDTSTLTNQYNYTFYNELFEDNISSISFYLKTANSINDKNIKLSERLFIPSNKLRGFEQGKVGPKDGNDYVGGNFVSSVNFSSNIPQIFPNSQNLDFVFFADVANIWGVDYNNSLDKTNEIRSSIGIGLDMFTPVGPLNFSFSQPITKASTDITETFRFNLGTTF